MPGCTCSNTKGDPADSFITQAWVAWRSVVQPKWIDAHLPPDLLRICWCLRRIRPSPALLGWRRAGLDEQPLDHRVALAHLPLDIRDSCSSVGRRRAVIEIQIHRDQHVIRPDIHRQYPTHVAHVGLLQRDPANRTRSLGANAFTDQQAARFPNERYRD